MTERNRTLPALGPTDLVWDHMSRHPDEDPVGRLYAAAAAGFSGIGLFVRRWQDLRQDPDHVERLDEALATTGLCIWGMEVSRGWSHDHEMDEERADFEAAAWDLAARYGCTYMQAIGRDVGPPETAAAGFGALCDRAAEHGVRIALEFVPDLTDIETAQQAIEVVERADRSNGGFCVDSWHLTRSTNRPDDILDIAGDRVFSVQLDDGPIIAEHEDYYTDTISNRVIPGQGEFALVEIVRKLDEIGFSCPIGLEVPSVALWAMNVDDAARVVYDGMQEVLVEARRTD
ncbi:MAG: sugar phosphate isomerase/epimerase family protein [Acidimicrobiales bacterium]